MDGMTAWTITLTPIGHPDAVAVLRAYFDDIVSRYHGRPATAAELDAAMLDDPSDDLAPPTGVFLVARAGSAVAGCVGARTLVPGVAELTRMFVHAGHRRLRGGTRLLAAAEDAARDLGADVLRLDTRHDLVEARALYAECGYTEIAPYSNSPYADHWFEKKLVG